MPDALLLSSVSKRYRSGTEIVDALRNVDLKVSTGEFLCITGPSGSGKTTLLKVSAGFLPPDQGKVQLFEQDLYQLSVGERVASRNRDVGFMFQEDLLLEDLTTFENVELPLIVQGVGRKERREKVRQVLVSVDISGLENRTPLEISGGERRRVSLARSLVNGCRILFADEPTSNLDTDTARSIVSMLKRLAGSGLTIVIATHDPVVTEQAKTTMKIRDGIIRT